MMKPIILVESNFDTQIITESEGDGKTKNLFIEGIFAQGEIPNGNRRKYPENVLDPVIQAFIDQFVNKNRAVGELDHPANRLGIDLERVSHLITKITKQKGEKGSVDWLGKAKILVGTPLGALVKGLIDGGVGLGVSTRGSGSVQMNNEGISIVQPDFKLSTVDIVYQPSAPDAFVQGLMENDQFVWGSPHADMEFIQNLKEQFRQVKRQNMLEAKVGAFNAFINKFSAKG